MTGTFRYIYRIEVQGQEPLYFASGAPSPSAWGPETPYAPLYNDSWMLGPVHTGTPLTAVRQVLSNEETGLLRDSDLRVVRIPRGHLDAYRASGDPTLNFGEIVMASGRRAVYVLTEGHDKARCVVFRPGGGGGAACQTTRDKTLRAALTDAGCEGVENMLLDPKDLTAAEFSEAMRGRMAATPPGDIFFRRAANHDGREAVCVLAESAGGVTCVAFGRARDGGDSVGFGHGRDADEAACDAIYRLGWEDVDQRLLVEISAAAFLAMLRKGDSAPKAETHVDPLLLPDASAETASATDLRERLVGALDVYLHAQIQAHNTVLVLLGYRARDEFSAADLFGGNAQFSLSGAAQRERVAYLRGRYDLLATITGDILAFVASTSEVYNVEGED